MSRRPDSRDFVLQMRVTPITPGLVATCLSVSLAASYALLSRMTKSGFLVRVVRGEYELRRQTL